VIGWLRRRIASIAGCSARFNFDLPWLLERPCARYAIMWLSLAGLTISSATVIGWRRLARPRP